VGPGNGGRATAMTDIRSVSFHCYSERRFWREESALDEETADSSRDTTALLE